jgi:hypothetical protein
VGVGQQCDEYPYCASFQSGPGGTISEQRVAQRVNPGDSGQSEHV